jgi:hypothetical protein
MPLSIQMWEERHFRSKSSFYVNPFEKVASFTRPKPPAPCLGGILADDMGMGTSDWAFSSPFGSSRLRTNRLAQVKP